MRAIGAKAVSAAGVQRSASSMKRPMPTAAPAPSRLPWPRVRYMRA
jgi:hypothetical protein